MKNEKINEIIGGISDRFVEEAALYPERKTMPERTAGRRLFRRGWALAACLALVLAAGIGGYSLMAEAKEYRAALAFFEENGLSAEGLSRAEVRAVARDITTGRFTYGKTAEVLRQTVDGWAIAQREPTPEELATVWERSVWRQGSVRTTGYSYHRAVLYRQTGPERTEVFDKSVLECFRDGELSWTAEFTQFAVEGSVHTAAGTAVWGRGKDDRSAWFARVDDEGTILWTRCLLHGFGQEYIVKVLDNGDGTWEVISRGDLQYLCLARIDMDGDETRFVKNEAGNRGIWNAARLGDGYLIQMGSRMEKETALLVRLDEAGTVEGELSYKGDDCEYYLTDMAEFGGQVYLSAYAVPLQEEDYGRREIAGILKTVYGSENWEIPDEELLPLVRANYTAVLLVCSPDGGEPDTFWSVEGSLGGELSVNGAGELEWDVESISHTFFSVATSSFTIGGTSRVFRYTFDGAGNLTGQTDTGEEVPYRR